jgi:hypothetical protein
MAALVRRWWWAGALALAAVGVGLWLVWPSGGEPRAREYRDVTACLLTDDQGVAGPQAATVWAGMQDASRQTHGQIRYLAVAGEQTKDNTSSFLGSLVVGRCAVIVAAGPVPVQTVVSEARRYPGQRFLVVGADPGASPNVSTVSGSGGERARSSISAAVARFLAAP